jgi:hypothetical protein
MRIQIRENPRASIVFHNFKVVNLETKVYYLC